VRCDGSQATCLDPLDLLVGFGSWVGWSFLSGLERTVVGRPNHVVV
jgi:hypothetical protein